MGTSCCSGQTVDMHPSGGEGHDVGRRPSRSLSSEVARVIEAGSSSNGIQSHEDLFATLAAAGGAEDLKEKLKKGHTLNGEKFKVHLDGYDQTPMWSGNGPSARREIFYYDETDLMAMRVDGWKMHIGVKPKGLWFDEKYYPAIPYIMNLLMDPMEKMDPHSEEWGTWEGSSLRRRCGPRRQRAPSSPHTFKACWSSRRRREQIA